MDEGDGDGDCQLEVYIFIVSMTKYQVLHMFDRQRLAEDVDNKPSRQCYSIRHADAYHCDSMLAHVYAIKQYQPDETQTVLLKKIVKHLLK
jgi:hypothetical protein